jgi:hypothetical protein
MKTCADCEYRREKQQRIKDGVWKHYFCTHPEYACDNELLKPLLDGGRYISWDEQPLPDWCPKKLSNKAIRVAEGIVIAQGWFP